MKLKGELDSIGLTELFKTLAEEKATGVLTLSNPNGQKIIAIADGEIAVISDKIAERSRMGDLLIARGRLTEQQLAEALRIQRTNEPRTMLGDLLVKHGMIRPQDITDSLKFQMEEEIYDLFTWRNAEFDFDGERSIEEVVSDSGYENHVQRVSLNPQQLIAEATRRMEEWKAIEARLPSPYLCFKLTPKGEELSSKGTQATQQILKYLKEGRTIETTVKKSCLGRFNVCKAIVKLLDDGWIFPYPSSELRMLAAEHRSANRFSDAVYIYRRILEGLPTDSEKEELQELIDETLDAIRRAQESGEAVEGSETVSYKEAAERYKRKERFKRILVMIFLGMGCIAGVYYMSLKWRPPPTIAEDYRKALEGAGEAEKQKKYLQAVRIWEEFLAKLPDRNSPTGKLVQEQIDSLPLRHTEYMETLLVPLEARVKNGELDGPEKELAKLDALGDNPLSPRIKAALADIDRQRRAITEAQSRDKIEQILQEGTAKLAAKQYSPARTILSDVANRGTGSLSDLGDRAKTELKKLEDIETRSKEALHQAELEVEAGRAESAIPLLEKATSEWPELQSAESARKRIQQINTRMAELRQAIARAETVAAAGGNGEALGQFLLIKETFKEYQLAKSVDKRIADLRNQLSVADEAIKRAQDEFKRNKDVGLQIFKEVMRLHGPLMAQRNVKVPVKIIAFQPETRVRVDGNDSGTIGVEPMWLELPAGRSLQFEFAKDGYESMQNRIERLGPETLEMQVGLRRAPVNDLIYPKSSLFAAPRVIGNRLYVLHGPNLSVLEGTGNQTYYTIEKLFDDSANQRPNPHGKDVPVFVGEKSWWWARAPVEVVSDTKLVYPSRTREIFEIDLEKQQAKKIFSLPVEPVGRVFVDQKSYLGGRPLLAVGLADGTVRVYEFDKPEKPKWTADVDSAKAGAQGTLITGLVGRPKGIFLALSVSGKLVAYNTVDGRVDNSLDIKAVLAEGNALPLSPEEPIAAMVHVDGRLTVVDLNTLKPLWDLAFGRGLDEAAFATTSGGFVYVVNRNGELKKYGREKVNGVPQVLWSRALGGTATIPLHTGRFIYTATNTGTIYAIRPEDGSVAWDFRTQHKPTELYEANGHLYIATENGQTNGHLIILKID